MSQGAPDEARLVGSAVQQREESGTALNGAESPVVGRRRCDSERSDPENGSPDVEFKPIVSLPLVEVKTLEEEEVELLKM